MSCMVLGHDYLSLERHYPECRQCRVEELEEVLRASWDDPDYRVKRPKLWERVQETLRTDELVSRDTNYHQGDEDES